MTESSRVEYKFKLNDSFEREVVSFLNSEGGRILIGVDDSGKPVGLPHADVNQLQMKDRIKNNIQPSALEYCTISLEVIDGFEVVAVDVTSGLERPYYIRKFGMSPQGCFYRKGSSCEPMPEDLIERMYAGRMKNTLRKIPSPNQGVSFRELQIYYEGVGKPLNANFRSNLNLLTDDGAVNYAGYLLSDGSGLSVRFAKYEGKSRVVLLENEEFGFCSLMRAFDRLFDRLSVENKTFARITERRRVERRMVDSVALREAVLNAFLHNDYSYSGSPKFEMFADRLEITSVGGLPFGMSKEDFFAGLSVPRNPELMRVFRDLDYVENLGSGIPRILEVYGRDAFVVSESFVRVVLPFAEPLTPAEVSGAVSLPTNVLPFSSNDRLVLSAIERDKSVTVKGISAETGFAVRKVERILARLKGLGVVVRDGARKDGEWAVDYAVYAEMTGGLNGGLKNVNLSCPVCESEASGSSFCPDDAGESGGLKNVKEYSLDSELGVDNASNRVGVADCADAVGGLTGGLNGGLEKDEGKSAESKLDDFPSSFSSDEAGNIGGLSGGLNGSLEKDEGKSTESKSDEFPSSFSSDAPVESGGLTEIEISVLHELLVNPQSSLSAISEKIGLPRHRVEKIMNGLKKRGLVVRVGSVQRGHWEVLEEAKEAVQ